MTELMSANPAQVTSYVTAGTLGTGNTTQCSNLPPAPPLPNPPPSSPALDLCQWSISLQGASEQISAANVGGMVGAVGCITQLQASNSTLGSCTAGIYQVSVAWQGMNPTKAPAAPLSCGLGSYGGSNGVDERYRRVIAAMVTVGTTSCY
jgi:type IV pilus assembly protein PilV